MADATHIDGPNPEGRPQTRLLVPGVEARAAGAGTTVRVAVPHLTAPAACPPRIPGYFLSRRYKPEAVLGQNCRATVYKAWDTVLGIPVVLKFPPECLAQRAEAVEGIRREAMVTMQLMHENIVRVYNVVMVGLRTVLVMEYVNGETLRQILMRMGPLAPSTVLDIVRSCASALTYAHKLGIVHRDLKPENIMIGEDAVLKLVDFGTAVIERAPGEEAYLEGTPGYMSPEQIRGGEPVDARADIFALGAVTAELVTGRRVFEYDGDVHHLLGAPPQGLEALSPPVRAVVTRALAPNREDRWPSAGEFYQALARAIEVDRAV